MACIVFQYKKSTETGSQWHWMLQEWKSMAVSWASLVSLNCCWTILLSSPLANDDPWTCSWGCPTDWKRGHIATWQMVHNRNHKCWLMERANKSSHTHYQPQACNNIRWLTLPEPKECQTQLKAAKIHQPLKFISFNFLSQTF